MYVYVIDATRFWKTFIPGIRDFSKISILESLLITTVIQFYKVILNFDMFHRENHALFMTHNFLFVSLLQYFVYLRTLVCGVITVCIYISLEIYTVICILP